MLHINVIMQNHRAQKLSRADTFDSIRGCTDVSDALTSEEVTHSATDFIAVGQFDTVPILWRESMYRVTCCRESSVVLRKHGISGFFSASVLNISISVQGT